MYERGEKLNVPESGSLNNENLPVSPLKPIDETYLVLKGKEATPDRFEGQ